MNTTTTTRTTRQISYHVGPYLVRHERDDAGRWGWFAYGDGPTQPFARYATLRAARQALAVVR